MPAVVPACVPACAGAGGAGCTARARRCVVAPCAPCALVLQPRSDAAARRRSVGVASPASGRRKCARPGGRRCLLPGAETPLDDVESRLVWEQTVGSARGVSSHQTLAPIHSAHPALAGDERRWQHGDALLARHSGGRARSHAEDQHHHQGASRTSTCDSRACLVGGCDFSLEVLRPICRFFHESRAPSVLSASLASVASCDTVVKQRVVQTHAHRQKRAVAARSGPAAVAAAASLLERLQAQRQCLRSSRSLPLWSCS